MAAISKLTDAQLRALHRVTKSAQKATVPVVTKTALAKVQTSVSNELAKRKVAVQPIATRKDIYRKGK